MAKPAPARTKRSLASGGRGPCGAQSGRTAAAVLRSHALPALEARSNRERADRTWPGGTKVVGTMKGIENSALEAIRVWGAV